MAKRTTELKHLAPAERAQRNSGRFHRALSAVALGPKEQVGRLKEGIFEKFDATGHHASETYMGHGESVPKKTRLDDFNPLADARATRENLGLRNTTIVGVVRGDHYKHRPTNEAQGFGTNDEELARKNKVYVLKTVQPDKTVVCTLLSNDDLQEINQRHAAGKSPDLKDYGRQVQQGRRDFAGRDERHYWPYSTQHSYEPGAPEAQVSNVQFTTEVDDQGAIYIADGMQVDDVYHPSKNGTRLVHGDVYTPPAPTVVAGRDLRYFEVPAVQHALPEPTGADPWNGVGLVVSGDVSDGTHVYEFDNTRVWLPPATPDPNAPMHANRN